MHKLKSVLMEVLSDGGIQTKAGGAWELGQVIKSNQAAVSLRGAEMAPGSTFRYLGLDEDGEECYGVQLTVTFDLELMTPKSGGSQETEAFSQLVMEQLLYGQTGLAFRSMVLEKPEYDGLRDCFRATLRVETRVLAWGQGTQETFRVEGFRLNPSY